jgi:hypothetical protein
MSFVHILQSITAEVLEVCLNSSFFRHVSTFRFLFCIPEDEMLGE